MKVTLKTGPDYDMDCIECCRRYPGKSRFFNDLTLNVMRMADWMDAISHSLDEINNFCDRMEREGRERELTAASTIREIIYHNMDEYMPYMTDPIEWEDDEDD